MSPKPPLTVNKPTNVGASQSLLKRLDKKDAMERISRVFRYFIEVTERNPRIYTLTPAKAKMGLACFVDCLRMTGDPARAEEGMMLVVDELVNSDFHMATGKHKKGPTYNEWKHAFGSVDKMQEWIERYRR